MIAADGRIVWLHEIVNVIVENGVTIELVGVSGDITARKRTEESMALFRKLIDGSNDAIEVVDPATLHFLDVNEKACLDLGYQREEMLSMTVYDIDPVLDPSLHTRIDEKLRESGFVIMESQHRRKDGSTFPVEINITYIQLDRDYAVAVVRDITERKVAEGTLSKLPRRLIEAQEKEYSRVAERIARRFESTDGDPPDRPRTIRARRPWTAVPSQEYNSTASRKQPGKLPLASTICRNNSIPHCSTFWARWHP